MLVAILRHRITASSWRSAKIWFSYRIFLNSPPIASATDISRWQFLMLNSACLYTIQEYP
jgi:hypothetical protein